MNRRKFLSLLPKVGGALVIVAAVGLPEISEPDKLQEIDNPKSDTFASSFHGTMYDENDYEVHVSSNGTIYVDGRFTNPQNMIY